MDSPQAERPDEPPSPEDFEAGNTTISERIPFLLTVVPEDDSGVINPGDPLSFETNMAINPDNIDMCRLHPDYYVKYDIWFAMDTGGAIQWNEYSPTEYWFPCSGESVEVSEDFLAPPTGGDRERTLDVQLRTGDPDDRDDYSVISEDEFTVYEEIEPPIASISAPSSVTVGDSVTLDATSSTGEIEDYRWVGDLMERGETVTHSFDSEGTYEIAVEVEDWQGQTDTARTTVTAEYEPVQAEIDAQTSIEVGETLELDGTSSSGHGGIQEYIWTVDGVEIGQGSEVSHVFDQDGSFTIELAVTDDVGQTDTASTSVEVEVDLPVAQLDIPGSVDAGEEFELDASPSTQGTYFIDEHTWNVDGETLTGETTSYSFPEDAEGEHTVELTVTDTEGNSDITSEEVEVQPVEEDSTNEEENGDDGNDTDDIGDDSGNGEDDRDSDPSNGDDTDDSSENLLTWIWNLFWFR
ncbi:PKD domain-containing protein [Halobacteria archaeon AArc-curdl1]|uniref:PKD domain-containing protein n=1 Tax=Natronosalvus hydrolyticus TaxID=2979988 RepID=A0AAP2ZBS4_9EURY|nr:PKD domain-containing protein [Halobacteria archaeon AArc-curdl1]